MGKSFTVIPELFPVFSITHDPNIIRAMGFKMELSDTAS